MLIQVLKALFVNKIPSQNSFRLHVLVSKIYRQGMSNIMWLPTPIYERIPQFWFLLGLYFIAIGLYVGFNVPVSFLYIIGGFVCCMYGIGIYLVRLRYRQHSPAAEPMAVSVE